MAILCWAAKNSLRGTGIFPTADDTHMFGTRGQVQVETIVQSVQSPKNETGRLCSASTNGTLNLDFS